MKKQEETKKPESKLTILDVSNYLLEYFGKSPVFDPVGDFDKLTQLKEDATTEVELKRGMVIAALEHLTKHEVVREVKGQAKTWYVLTKPLEINTQQVLVSYPINVVMSKTINTFAKVNGLDYRADPFSIRESDIHCLLQIIDTLTPKETDE